MIARIFPLLILLIVLPDIYLHFRRWTKKKGYHSFRRLLWWWPSLLMLIYTSGLVVVNGFAPSNHAILYVYLFLIGLFVVPKAIYVLCSFVGWLGCRIIHSRYNFGKLIGWLLATFAIVVLLYGSTRGFYTLKVNHIELQFRDLPNRYNGYRIVQFSDLHVGSYMGNTTMVRKVVDSINAQHADMIVFTGDIENMRPAELDEVQSILSQLRANDGVYSVLGNHDYSFYIKADSTTKVLNEILLQRKERSMGWNLLMNEHKILRRGSDSLVIAGMENYSEAPYPNKGELVNTLAGIDSTAFVVMLQHDPSAWRRHILPQSHVQLTLSGHTHGGQLRFFGWSPVQLKYREWSGEYQEGAQTLLVSNGIGGFVPLRFGVPPTIEVITLKLY